MVRRGAKKKKVQPVQQDGVKVASKVLEARGPKNTTKYADLLVFEPPLYPPFTGIMLEKVGMSFPPVKRLGMPRARRPTLSLKVCFVLKDVLDTVTQSILFFISSIFFLNIC